jgi:hypothetical protein
MVVDAIVRRGCSASYALKGAGVATGPLKLPYGSCCFEIEMLAG